MTIINLIKLFFILVTIILFPFGLTFYQGNIIYYLIFSIISFYTLISSFNEDSISFESFFALLIWLGFWFKFTIQISFLKSQFPEGVGLFDYNSSSYDEVLLISSVGILGFLFSKFFRSKFLFNYNEFSFDKEIDVYLEFYINFRKKLIGVYVFFIIFFPLMNLIFIFFQKGTVPETILPFGLNNFVNWLLMFGLASITSILVFFEFKFKKKNSNNLLKIGFLENFISSVSILSRAMIFNSTSLLYGYYRLVGFSEIKINKKIFIKYFLIALTFFAISLVVVSKMRQNKEFPVGHKVHAYIPMIENIDKNSNLKTINNISKELNQIIFLIAGRWVGIEGVMTVYSNKNMGWQKFKMSFKDKFNFSNSFYENYVKGSKHVYELNPKIYTVYVPGIIGFLYYSHSLIFLFIAIFILCIICSYIEKIAFRFSKNNIIFSYLIGNVLAYRLIHFGYMPQNTYKIILVIIFNILLIIIMFKLLDLYNKK